MRYHGVVWALVALLLTSVGSTAQGASTAAEPLSESEEFVLEEFYEPSPGAIVGAFAINLVYAPVRFAITVVGAAIGGIEGLISAGDEEAANVMWGLTDGSQIITPAMLEGREQWTFSGYGW